MCACVICVSVYMYVWCVTCVSVYSVMSVYAYVYSVICVMCVYVCVCVHMHAYVHTGFRVSVCVCASLNMHITTHVCSGLYAQCDHMPPKPVFFSIQDLPSSSHLYHMNCSLGHLLSVPFLCAAPSLPAALPRLREHGPPMWLC